MYTEFLVCLYCDLYPDDVVDPLWCDLHTKWVICSCHWDDIDHRDW